MQFANMICCRGYCCLVPIYLQPPTSRINIIMLLIDALCIAISNHDTNSSDGYGF